MRKRTPAILYPILAFLGVFAGCSTQHYRKSADNESYQAIAEKAGSVPNSDPHFTIEQTNVVSLDGLPTVTQPDETLGTDAATEVGAHVVTLDKALEIGVKQSRNYQNNKEQLFLTALRLTLDRHQFTPIFSGGGTAAYEANTEQALEVIPDPATGTPRVVLSESLIEQDHVTARGFLSATMLLRTGARLSAAFTTDFLRFLTGDPRTMTSSQLGATLVQPLWRGAGYKVTMENLTQSERNLLYQLREFSRFRREFAVQIASSYYRVLQSRDVVANNWRGLQNFKRNVERENSLAEEGLRTQASLGLIKQNELSTETQWINAIRAYKLSLDNFKLQLGLSTDSHLVLDNHELEQLKIAHPNLTSEEAVQVALTTRLDLYNARDQVTDSQRKIYVAADQLKPQVDLVAAGGINSAQETGMGFPLPDPARYHWNAGLALDLPLERKAERNNYRAALINFEQAMRQLSQNEDQIKLEVREDWRALDGAKRNYEISEIGVDLSQRRVEEQELRAEVGRGTARDLVDAQNDLISSKNQRTQALVGHTIARLQFWNDMGILFIKENGKWEERADAKSYHN